jgi:uncharacterized repeat protein (TIGR03803 family)
VEKRLGALALAFLTACAGAQLPVELQGNPHATSRAASHAIVYSFLGGDDGEYPAPEDAPLRVLGGILYGTTSSGGVSRCGSYGCGTFFQLTTNGDEQVLYRFTGAPDAGNPSGPITHYKNIWYGLAGAGGAENQGAVYALTNAGVEHVVYSFKGGNDGATPFGGLLPFAGTLYGTTSYGGRHNLGTVFAITPSGTEKVLHSFELGADGAHPYDGLTLLGGKMYGTTIDGGTYGYGAVFEIELAGRERIVYSFDYGNDGASPQAPLTAIGGKLYGTTTDGGGSGYNGTAFEVSISGKEQILHRFSKSATDGYFPQSTLLYHDGALYGTTYVGGQGGGGIVFRLSLSGKEEVLHYFEGAPNDGWWPTGGLIAAGKVLYGSSYAGGSGDCAYNEGCGTVFKITP